MDEIRAEAKRLNEQGRQPAAQGYLLNPLEDRRRNGDSLRGESDDKEEVYWIRATSSRGNRG